MIVKICDICGKQEDFTKGNLVTSKNYYGIQKDICRMCRDLFDESFEKKVDFLFNEVAKDIKRARGIV